MRHLRSIRVLLTDAEHRQGLRRSGIWLQLLFHDGQALVRHRLKRAARLSELYLEQVAIRGYLCLQLSALEAERRRLLPLLTFATPARKRGLGQSLVRGFERSGRLLAKRE